MCVINMISKKGKKALEKESIHSMYGHLFQEQTIIL